MRIVFMGTPEFAVASLEAILNAGFQVVGVVTATDKYGGRGKKKLIKSAVKAYAEAKGLPVLQPKNLKSSEFVIALSALKADVQIVVAFRMLPEVVWNMPPLGTYNLHGSLLPKYRGAAPINWAVIRGEIETGVTTFKLKHEIDTGDMILQRRMTIGPNETVGEVHDRMKELGAKAIVDTLEMIKSNSVSFQKQDEALVTKAPKIFPHMCEISFDGDCQIVHNFIRGLSPYPGAWTILKGLKLKILKSTVDNTPHDLHHGRFISDNQSFLKISCGNGFVNIHKLQIEGKRAMDIRAFLNGYQF